MIRHMPIVPTLLAMDHPGQQVTNYPCCKEREPRVVRNPLMKHLTPLVKGAFSLWKTFAGLTHIALALAVSVSGRGGGCLCHILQSLLDLIQNLFGSLLLGLILPFMALIAGGGYLSRLLRSGLLRDGYRDWIARWEGLLNGMVEPCIEVLLRVLGQLIVWRTLRRLTLLSIRSGLAADTGCVRHTSPPGHLEPIPLT